MNNCKECIHNEACKQRDDWKNPIYRSYAPNDKGECKLFKDFSVFNLTLKSLLKVMGEPDKVEIIDIQANISNMCLFEGTVKDCKARRALRNSIIDGISAADDTVMVMVRRTGDEQKA